MQANLKARQQGQGWLVSFAALILLVAIGAVVYTVINGQLTIKEPPKKELPVATFTDDGLADIANNLAKNYLSASDSGRKEDIQALANTLSNLKSNPNEAAKTTLQQLRDDKLSDALSTLKAFALTTKSKRDAAKLWVDIGNIENLKAKILALSINKELGNVNGEASNSENLAGLYRSQKNFDKAEEFYLKALELYQSSNQTAKQIETHSALGSLYQTQQQTELALAEYEKALNLNKTDPSDRFSAGLYSNMGILAQQKNELERAEEYFNQSLTIYQTIESPQGTADQYSNLAILARSKKQFEEGETLHLKAIALYEAVENKQAVTSQYTNLGFLYTAWNKKDTACEYWQKSLEGLAEAKHQSRKDRIQAIVERDCKVLDTKVEADKSVTVPALETTTDQTPSTSTELPSTEN